MLATSILKSSKNVVDPEVNIVMFTTRNVIMKKKTTCSKMCRAVYAQTQKHESNRRASFHHKKKAQ